MYLRLSVCVSVPFIRGGSKKSWRRLVEEGIAEMRIWSPFQWVKASLIFIIFFFYVLMNQPSVHRGEFAWGESVSVAVDICDWWLVTSDRHHGICHGWTNISHVKYLVSGSTFLLWTYAVLPKIFLIISSVFSLGKF